MTSKVTIDGKEYDLPRMKFKTLKKAFPIMEKIQGSENPIEMSEAAISVVSLALVQNPEYAHMTPEWIEDNIDAAETFGLAPAMFQLMQDSGLIPQGATIGIAPSGEAPGAIVIAPSTETSTPSSQNSSPLDVAEPIGTP